MDLVGTIFAALADPTRRAILDRVRGEPRSVAEIAGFFEVSRPAISQHLRILQGARLLQMYRSGRQNFYALDLQGLGEVRGYLEHFWEGVLSAFQAAAVEQARGKVRGDR
jgi:DNA-binding transcriptional ArsR family regulator